MEKGRGKVTDTLQTDNVFTRKEYTEREKVVELLNKWADGYSYIEVPTKDAIACVRAIPAADVVPVVRCKNCRHRDPEDHKCDSGETERQGCPFKVADDYFCAYGERRSE